MEALFHHEFWEGTAAPALPPSVGGDRRHGGKKRKKKPALALIVDPELQVAEPPIQTIPGRRVKQRFVNGRLVEEVALAPTAAPTAEPVVEPPPIRPRRRGLAPIPGTFVPVEPAPGPYEPVPTEPWVPPREQTLPAWRLGAVSGPSDELDDEEEALLGLLLSL